MESPETRVRRPASGRPWSLLAVVFAVGLASCGPSTELVTWTDPEFEGPGFRSLMVMVMTDNLKARTAIEGAIAQKLEARKIAALQSLSLLSPDAILAYDSLEIELSNRGIDGILIAEPLGSEAIQRYSEGITYYQTYSTFIDTRSTRLARQTEPNKVEVIGTIYHTRTNLYANNSDRLVWRAESETPFYGDVSTSSRDFAERVVTALETSGMLRPTPPPRSR